MFNKTAYESPSTAIRNVSSLMAAMLLLVLTGCGASYPDVPESQRTIDVDYDYILGPGDAVGIFVWGNEELSTAGTIRPDGKLTTHLVEDLQASGKTSSELARDIEAAYAEYVRQPVVSVTVSGFRGVPEQAIRVLGEATNPMRIPFRKHMTLLDLVISVSGLTAYADGNNSVLVRMVDGKEMTYRLRIDDLIKDGDISANISMMPGDILIIAESWF